MKSAVLDVDPQHIVKSLTLSELAQTDASALLASLYSAVGNDAAWHEVVYRFCFAFDAHAGMLVVAGQGQRDQSFYAAHNHADGVARAYSEHWWQHDLWLHGALEQGIFRAGWMGRGSDWVKPAALRDSAFYKDFLLTMPAEHLLCAVLSDGTGPLRAPRLKATAIVLVVVGVAMFGWLLASDTTRAWSAFLQGMLIPTYLGIGATFFMAVHCVTNAKWTLPLRRRARCQMRSKWASGTPARLRIAVPGGP